MLPYPNPHHFGVSQEPPHPNPTGFPMLPPAAHLDQHYADHHFFPGHGQFNSETLEAVLRPPRAAPESGPVVTAPQGGRNGAAAAGQGHARARKRPFRTDRHSKIRTAQGVRDRRMRLSLDVAHDFFALQDRLGFDKASKTVDWLLTQSKPAIDRLTEPSQRCAGGSDAALSSPTSGAPNGSGNKRGGLVEKAGTRNGGSVFMEHGCELDRLVSAAPALGEYYYAGLSEMMSNNGGEGDDDGEYEEDGDDFLDGMQY
ncbi:hypothetical protein C2845_PMPSC040726 [Panicum miliaceum]|uniref:TCP domain-containing protein n=1 Tax=Panicum miliaceum TaxID=4540 RepID=A0A3L6PDF5_PANMI|nr:hypothetical protein C2845_PMPSC040726 [Panicum miliaceum]